MAIIVSRGARRWWLDPSVVLQCESCDTIFRLEPTDEASTYGRDAVVATCPVCAAKVVMSRPESTKPVKGATGPTGPTGQGA